MKKSLFFLLLYIKKKTKTNIKKKEKKNDKKKKKKKKKEKKKKGIRRAEAPKEFECIPDYLIYMGWSSPHEFMEGPCEQTPKRR